MNTITQPLAIKLQKYTFFELIDKKGSFILCQNLLSAYQKEWRKEHKSGGITANHRQLIWALLKILPTSMEWMREKQPRRFGHAVKYGRFKIKTNRITLAKKMMDLNTFSGQFDLLSVRTITNLLNRLVEAKVLTYKRTEKDTDRPERLAMLIEFNPQVIKLFTTIEEATAIEAAHASTDGPQAMEEEPMEEEPTMGATVEEGAAWIQKAQKIAEEEGRLAKAEKADHQSDGGQVLKHKGKTLRHYTNTLDRTNKKNKKRVAAFSEENHQNHVKKLRQSRQSKNTGPIYAIYSQFLWALYQKNHLPNEKEKAVLKLLEQNMERAANFVRQWRAHSLEKVKTNPRYMGAKDKTKFLANFGRLLPDVEKRAFEIVAHAIQIQKEWIKRNDYNFFVDPVKYLSTHFGQYMEWAMDQIRKSWQNPIKNSLVCAHNDIKNKIGHAVWAVNFTHQKWGRAKAVETYQRHHKELFKLLHKYAMEGMVDNMATKYMARFKDQLAHIFN